MSAPVDVLAVIKRIAETNAAFATTADRDGIVRVGESMLALQAADLRAVSAAVAKMIKALQAFIALDPNFSADLAWVREIVADNGKAKPLAEVVLMAREALSLAGGAK